MQNINSKTLIVVVGPTAIGKTALAIELAQYFNCDIISADSRQFFREMSIGTAKPSKVELAMVNHHFVGHLSIQDQYNAGDFEKDVIDKLENDLFLNNNISILVGGSGMYIRAVCEGLDHIPATNAETRENLNLRFKNEGLEVLSNELKILDPDFCINADLQNSHRVIRALEVCIDTRKPFSSFRKSTVKNRSFNIIKIGLNTERQFLYHRINQRVLNMIDLGLENEVKSLLHFKDLNALNTVGYKEFFEGFDTGKSINEIVTLVQQNTRRFAKRQMTWFQSEKDIKWFDTQNNLKENVIQYLKSALKYF